MTDVDGERKNLTNSLKTSLTDSSIWQSVFRKVEPIFKFYSELDYEDTDDMMYWCKNNIFYKENETFQEYIDSLYNMKKLGPYDFATFCKNMQYENFHNKMEIQYRLNKRNNLLKDYIISIAKLHIHPDNFHFEEYQQMLPRMINAIPYFEYLAQKEWLIYEIEDGTLFEESHNSGERTELRALKMIQQTLFV